MTDHRFTLARYDQDRPWIVLSRDRMSVELDDGQDFRAWARDRFPGRSQVVEPDVGGRPAWRPGRT